MFFSLLLTGVLATQAPPSQPATTAQPTAREASGVPLPSSAEAAALAAAGQTESALQAFERLAAANPADLEARLAIADLEMRLHRYDRAESVYRGVHLDDPTSARAAIGVAESLGRRRRFEEAIGVLEAADRTTQNHAGILAVLGRMHTELGQGSRAVAYLRRAAVYEPTNHNQARVRRAEAAHDHRVELGGLLERFDGSTPDSRGADLRLQYRLSDALRLSGRGQWQRKFASDDVRGGAGVEWRWARASFLTADVLYGKGNRVLPVTDGYVGLEQRFPFATGRIGVRIYDFAGTSVLAIEPAVTWFLNDLTTLDLRYDYTSTNLPLPRPDARQHHGLVRGTRQLSPALAVFGGYARGIEGFDALSTDRILGFEANTASAGGRVALPLRSTVEALYEYQWRESGRKMQRATLTLGHRF